MSFLRSRSFTCNCSGATRSLNSAPAAVRWPAALRDSSHVVASAHHCPTPHRAADPTRYPGVCGSEDMGGPHRRRPRTPAAVVVTAPDAGPARLPPRDPASARHRRHVPQPHLCAARPGAHGVPAARGVRHGCRRHCALPARLCGRRQRDVQHREAGDRRRPVRGQVVVGGPAEGGCSRPVHRPAGVARAGGSPRGGSHAWVGGVAGGAACHGGARRR